MRSTGLQHQRGAEALARFTEAESGKTANRPQLTAAIQLARSTGATLVIAKLDRLSRNASFLLTLRDSGVHFLAVDMPQANDLSVGIMALVAQAEQEAISRSTKEALAVAKARGIKLGNPNGADAVRRADRGAVALREAVGANADKFAAELGPVVEDIRAQGHVSLRAIAAELNLRGMMTRRGGHWQVSNARNLISRRAEAYRSRVDPSVLAATKDRIDPGSRICVCNRNHRNSANQTLPIHRCPYASTDESTSKSARGTD